MRLLELLHKVYTPLRCNDARMPDLFGPRTILQRPNASNFLTDLGLLAQDESAAAHASNDKGGQMQSRPSNNKDPKANETENGSKKPIHSIIQILADHYEGLTPEELIQLCKPERSYKQTCLNYTNDVKVSKWEDPDDLKEGKVLSFIEFVELVCRAASVLEMDISRFIKEKLLGLLRWKHNQLWAPKRGHALAPGEELEHFRSVLP